MPAENLDKSRRSVCPLQNERRINESARAFLPFLGKYRGGYFVQLIHNY